MTESIPIRGGLRRALTIVAGPAAVVTCLTLHASAGLPAADTISWPLVLIAIGVTLPALYIFAALAGAAPPLTELFSTSVRALEASSIALLGVTPALAFLVATAVDIETVRALALACGALGSGIVLRGVFLEAFRPQGARAGLVFVVWSLITFGLVVHLLFIGR